MKFYLLLFSLLSAITFASTKSLIYKIDNKFVQFFEIKKGVFATIHCLKSDKCQALQKSQQLKNVLLPTKIGGQNPLALLCEEKMQGEIQMGINKNKSEQSFCVFKDDSAIMVSSLNEFR